MQLCEILLVQFPEKVDKKSEPIFRAILYCCTVSSVNVRQSCLTILKKIVGSLSGAVIARALLKEMLPFLESRKVSSGDKDDNKENDSHLVLSPHSIVECLTSICSSKGMTPEDVHFLAMDSLLPSHHPSVVNMAPDLWVKIVKHLECKPKDLIVQRASHFRKVLVDEYKNTPTNQNALSTLISINADTLLPQIIQKVIGHLEDPRICQVSKDDYFTFLTPEGELYDKSIVPGGDSNAEMNLKRESKVNIEIICICVSAAHSQFGPLL